MSTRKLFVPYPAMRYKQGEKPRRVENKVEDDKLLGVGWSKLPQIEKVSEHIHQGDAASKKMLKSMVNEIASIVNMLTRLDKVKSKKDLLWLAEMLAIPIADGLTVKKMKAKILKESKKMDELQAAIKEAEANVDSPKTH